MRKLFIAAVLATVALPAEAQHCNGTWQPYACVGVSSGHIKTCYRCVYPRTYYRERYRDRDPHWRDVERGRHGSIHHYSDDGDEDGPRCREVRRAVGQQHLTMEGAKREANDAWAGMIRFHLGEKFLDLNNARRISYSCSRSSIKAEGSVTTLGQTFTRCEIEAQPCRPRRESSEEIR
jgi:hypothetical protein